MQAKAKFYEARRMLSFFMALVLVFMMSLSLVTPVKAVDAAHTYYIQMTVDTSNWTFVGAVVNDKNPLFGNYTEVTRIGSSALEQLKAGSAKEQKTDKLKPVPTTSSGDDLNNKVLSFPGFDTKDGLNTPQASSAQMDRAVFIKDKLIYDLNTAIHLVYEDKTWTNLDAFLDDVIRLLNTAGTHTGGIDDWEFSGASDSSLADKKNCISADDYVKMTNKVSGTSYYLLTGIQKYPTDWGPDQKGDGNNDTAYITWSMMVYEALVNSTLDKDAVNVSNVYNNTAPSVLEDAVICLMTNFLNGVQSILGLWNIEELVFNQGARGTQGYVAGIFPEVWQMFIWTFFIISEILSFAIILFAIGKNIVERASATVNPVIRANMMEQVKDMAVSIILLILLPYLLIAMMKLSASLVSIFSGMLGEKTLFEGFLSTSGGGSLAGVIVGIANIGIHIYFNFFYVIRSIIVAILISLSPLFVVSMSLGGRKKMLAQRWAMELAANIFIQPIHAIVLSFIILMPKTGRAIETLALLYCMIPLTGLFKGLMFPGVSDISEKGGAKAKEKAEEIEKKAGGAIVGAGAALATLAGAINTSKVSGKDASGQSGSNQLSSEMPSSQMDKFSKMQKMMNANNESGRGTSDSGTPEETGQGRSLGHNSNIGDNQKNRVSETGTFDKAEATQTASGSGEGFSSGSVDQVSLAGAGAGPIRDADGNEIPDISEFEDELKIPENCDVWGNEKTNAEGDPDIFEEADPDMVAARVGGGFGSAATPEEAELAGFNPKNFETDSYDFPDFENGDIDYPNDIPEGENGIPDHFDPNETSASKAENMESGNVDHAHGTDDMQTGIYSGEMSHLNAEGQLDQNSDLTNAAEKMKGFNSDSGDIDHVSFDQAGIPIHSEAHAGDTTEATMSPLGGKAAAADADMSEGGTSVEHAQGKAEMPEQTVPTMKDRLNQIRQEAAEPVSPEMKQFREARRNSRLATASMITAAATSGMVDGWRGQVFGDHLRGSSFKNASSKYQQAQADLQTASANLEARKNLDSANTQGNSIPMKKCDVDNFGGNGSSWGNNGNGMMTADDMKNAGITNFQNGEHGSSFMVSGQNLDPLAKASMIQAATTEEGRELAAKNGYEVSPVIRNGAETGDYHVSVADNPLTGQKAPRMKDGNVSFGGDRQNLIPHMDQCQANIDSANMVQASPFSSYKGDQPDQRPISISRQIPDTPDQNADQSFNQSTGQSMGQNVVQSAGQSVGQSTANVGQSSTQDRFAASDVSALGVGTVSGGDALLTQNDLTQAGIGHIRTNEDGMKYTVDSSNLSEPAYQNLKFAAHAGKQEAMAAGYDVTENLNASGQETGAFTVKVGNNQITGASAPRMSRNGEIYSGGEHQNLIPNMEQIHQDQNDHSAYTSYQADVAQHSEQVITPIRQQAASQIETVDQRKSELIGGLNTRDVKQEYASQGVRCYDGFANAVKMGGTPEVLDQGNATCTIPMQKMAQQGYQDVKLSNDGKTMEYKVTAGQYSGNDFGMVQKLDQVQQLQANGGSQQQMDALAQSWSGKGESYQVRGNEVSVTKVAPANNSFGHYTEDKSGIVVNQKSESFYSHSEGSYDQKKAAIYKMADTQKAQIAERRDNDISNAQAQFNQTHEKTDSIVRGEKFAARKEKASRRSSFKGDRGTGNMGEENNRTNHGVNTENQGYGRNDMPGNKFTE